MPSAAELSAEGKKLDSDRWLAEKRSEAPGQTRCWDAFRFAPAT